MRFPRMLPQKLPLAPITRAALECFAVNGYHGTTIRQIATAAGLSVPGVYHHFGSKHEILVGLSEVAMRELIDASERAIVAAGEGVLDRFDALVESLVEFHADFSDVAFVSFSEIRSLKGQAQERHLEQRRREQQMITDVVEEGVDTGVFATDDPRHVARAITSICLGISQWYRPGRELSSEELTDSHVRICRDTARWVGSHEAKAAAKRSTGESGEPSEETVSAGTAPTAQCRGWTTRIPAADDKSAT